MNTANNRFLQLHLRAVPMESEPSVPVQLRETDRSDTHFLATLRVHLLLRKYRGMGCSDSPEYHPGHRRVHLKLGPGGLYQHPSRADQGVIAGYGELGRP